jgi:hypothetical protein
MLDLFKISILILAIAFVLSIEYLIRKGRLKRANTYSYRSVLVEGVRTMFIAFIICFLLYFYSKSFEVSLTLGIVSIFFIIAGCIRGLITEHQIKRKGGRKE